MKILIIDKMHDSILPLLRQIGCEGDYRPAISREEVIQVIEQYSGLIVRSKMSIDADFISKATHLVFVGRAGAGTDNVDIEAMNKYGIHLLNAPEGNRDAVAEHTLALILSLFNKITIGNQQIRSGIWDREANRGVELKAKVVGILGFGYMGKAVAERLKSFGCEILVFDTHQNNLDNGEEGVNFVDFEEFTQRVNVLSIHIPLNEQNRLLINKSYLNKFKELHYVINTARGEVLDLSDMVELLEREVLKGAALDVLPNEKIHQLSVQDWEIYEKLFQFEQVVLSPHVAGWTDESYEKINHVLVEKIQKILDIK